ncbi:MAG: hypothetical protein WC441_01710 [Patescibacteria group bacterium]
MHYKIASLILNAGKTPNTINRVFIAQPDALKESLAGRLFVLAEIKGRRVESEKILAFLVNTINADYYGDEKILLRQKVETIKVENIFESVLTKTNKSLVDFINEEKIKISQYSANLVVGVVYENKLYFSNLGKNKSLLIYPRQDRFAVTNVESGSEEENGANKAGGLVHEPKFFSSVVSGEIPANSYFVFTNEALPEYLSPKELTTIVTKLPPIVAAEQIKNTLAQINSYVPFLGIIIKNSFGQDLESEIYEKNVSAQSSISSLNYTEEKTEKMLSPAGIINLKKTSRSLGKIIRNLWPKKPERPQSSREISRQEVRSERTPMPALPLKAKDSPAPRESFIIKEKIFGRRQTISIWPPIKNALQNFVLIFSGSFIQQLGKNIKNAFSGLNRNRRGLLIILGAFILILIASLAYTKINNHYQAQQKAFDDLVAQIEDKQSQVDSYLLYNNEEGAKLVLINLQELLKSFPQKSKKEKEKYKLLEAKVTAVAERVQHLTKTDRGQEILKASDIKPEAAIDNLFFLNGQLYLADNKNHNVYSFDLKNKTQATIGLANSSNLSHPSEADGNIYYLDDKQLMKVDLKTKTGQILKIEGLNSALSDYRLYNSGLYILSADSSQIYRLNLKGDTFSSPTPWLKEQVDLKDGTTFTIDGTIYVLKKDGSITKLYRGKRQDLNTSSIIPPLTQASKLISGSKYFYVFELASKRLAVFAKNDVKDGPKAGAFLAQFDLSAFDSLKDIQINETEKLAYILDGSSVYSLKLNY